MHSPMVSLILLWILNKHMLDDLNSATTTIL